ncbi:MAG: hypothetical protein GX640_15435 [Fibrobacter sp.]|nr:hypothetical protein [Fibrobacter sp.]
MILNIEQKKGDPSHLDGRITVYAWIDIDPSELISMKHPIASMVHNGYIVAQGNFKEQSSLKDFLKSEMGISFGENLDEGLAQLLDKMNGLESALDPQKLKDRLENMSDFEEFIPTPAKVVPFHSESEILAQEGDVFFIGAYKNIGNAVLGVNALPILYQARFREQEISKVRNEIEMLISQIERSESINNVANTENVEEKLLKEFIPNLLYSRKEPHMFEEAQGQFCRFMSGYRFKEDIDAIISILGGNEELTSKQYKLLELYAKKIAAVKKEDFSAAEAYNKEIQQLLAI